MTPEQVQQIIDLLTNVGGSLASKGYEIAFRQIIIESIMWTIVSVFLIIIPTMAGVRVRSWINRKEEDGNHFVNDESDRSMVTVLTWLGTSFMWLIGSLILVDNVVRLLNPQWYAIKYLLSAVTGG